MNNPLVSIIIPVYNGANYLKEAIESALSQSYTNIEILVINDGSKDNGDTEKIALSYGEKIRYFSKQNGGVATALNLAIKEMKGEYFSWLSHDDYYYTNKIEVQIKAIRDNGDPKTIVYGAYDLLETETGKITHIDSGTIYEMEKLQTSIFPVLMGSIHGCAMLIHKSHFERCGIFNEQLRTTQDYDLWFRIFRGQKTIYLSESLVVARVHSKQGSKTLVCHELERNELYMNFIRSVTTSEMNLLFGGEYNFYYYMMTFLRGSQMENAFIHINNKLQECEIPNEAMMKMEKLKNRIRDLGEGNTDKICIFCCGQWGMRLFFDLRSKLINVDCFSDNNPNKWGYICEGIHCISPTELKKEKDRTLVIVATRTSTSIVEQLKQEGFPYVITKQELDKELAKVAGVKWMTALDSLEGIEYSNENIMKLVNEFKKTIFDICTYYQQGR